MKGREGKKGGVDILVDSERAEGFRTTKRLLEPLHGSWNKQEEEEIVVQDEQVGEGVEEDEVYSDPRVSGRNYSIDETTGTSYWR